jgi:diguanylate cyclase (GGDEF)-like protein/PAS domain S-box-containing protein
MSLISRIRDWIAGAALRDAEERASLAHNRLVTAINALPEGVVFLDAEGRYILWNQRYAEIYSRSADLFFEGARLQDTLRVGVERGDYPEAIGREEQWLEERLALLQNPGVRHEQRLADGRCVMIEERRTPDGDTVGLRVDITEMKRREETFRALFENNPTPLLIYDPSSATLLAANEAATRHYGYAPGKLAGRAAQELFAPDEWHDARRALEQHGSISERVFRQLTWDGFRVESILFTRHIDHEGRPAVLVSVFDVTERRRAEAKMAHMARHDDLTGLANRIRFRETLNDRLDEIAADGSAMAVLIVDLDDFKSVNDTLGHSVGDDVLTEAARRMKRAAGEGTLVARLGGDEFALLAPIDETGSSHEELARRIVEEMEQQIESGPHAIRIGASVGIALAPTDSLRSEELMKFADLALYAAKRSGRGAWRLFEPRMDAIAQEKRKLEADLRRAIEAGELAVYYQPLIELRTGETEAYEALLRWNHPERGLVSPLEFVPLAEEIGLIDAIGQFVLQTACRDAVTWPAGTRVAVNISPVQFRGSGLLTTVVQALGQSGLEPSRLELEITEAVLMEKSEGVLSTMHALRGLGVSIAMDDFGTGYSSLSYLRSYPFSKIKIDRSFVDQLDQRPNSQAIVRAIISLGESLGMMVTAEGIEEPAVLDYLKAHGCMQGQGYIFAEPLPASSIASTQAKGREAA